MAGGEGAAAGGAEGGEGGGRNIAGSGKAEGGRAHHQRHPKRCCSGNEYEHVVISIQEMLCSNEVGLMSHR